MRSLLFAAILIAGCSKMPTPDPKPTSSVSYSDACKLVDERLERFNEARRMRRELVKLGATEDSIADADEAVEIRHRQLKEAYDVKAALEPKAH